MYGTHGLCGRADLGALIVAVHRVTQRQLPVIVMGAGLPSLPGLSGEARSYAERLFQYPTIGALPPDAARAALTEPTARLGVSFDPPALAKVVRVTKGHPCFIRKWGAALWDRLDAPRITLRALAEAGTPCTSAAAARLLGKGTSAFGPVRDSLLRRTLIWSPRREVLEFTVPGFDGFMRRVVPEP